MIRVRLARNRLAVSGHAQSGPPGHDLVCAAVSALSQALVYGLGEVAGVPVTVECWEKGRLEARWPEPLGDSANAILATCVGALREIAERNPAHVEVLEE